MLKLLVLFMMWFLMLLTSAVESLAVSLGVVAFNLTANVVSAAVVAAIHY